jgi:alcohol dehydrogenase class IV
MNDFTFFNPVRVLFGSGSFDQIGERAAGIGKHAMLVTGRSAARKSGLLDRATGLLEAAGVDVTVFDRIMPNPTDEIVDEGGEMARREGVDVIVALGGGSSMDAAKGIAIAATHEAPISEFLRVQDKRTPTEATLPIICATTTSGTASEVTPFAVISTVSETMKSAIANDFIYPRVAIIDPELTITCPASVTANTGADVLAHAMEGYFSTAASPLTDLFAERAIYLVGRHLPRAVEACGDLQEREQMSFANLCAGYVLSNCGASVIHALEHPISAHYPEVAHGAGLATMMAKSADQIQVAYHVHELVTRESVLQRRLFGEMVGVDDDGILLAAGGKKPGRLRLLGLLGGDEGPCRCERGVEVIARRLEVRELTPDQPVTVAQRVSV